jgi:histidine triad (HIT) family protein
MNEVECVFCEIIAGRAPADIVYQDALTVAFIDPRQHNPGHVLVVPRTHIGEPLTKPSPMRV